MLHTVPVCPEDYENTDQRQSSPHRKPHADYRQWWLVVAVTVGVVLSALPAIDRYAANEYDALFQRALVTFALARTLNGVISAVQGTELALQPAGVGVTLTPGEILDPVNDLVERFSWIMLGATLSLGVQQVLLEVGQWWALRLSAVLLGVVWLLVTLRRAASEERAGSPRSVERLILQTLLLVLLLRFAVPAVMIANEALYRLFLEPKYAVATQVIETAGSEIERAGQVPIDARTDVEEGVFDSLERIMNSTRETLDVRKRLDQIEARAAELVEHLIQLSVVFILQTAVLPLAFLWLLVQLVKRLLRNAALGQGAGRP